MRSCLTAISLLCLFLVSCNDRLPQENEVKSELWVPVYSLNTEEVKRIIAQPPRRTLLGGKIFTVGNRIYQVELDSGIHVIDYSNPASPQKLSFIRSFLCKEVAVKNGMIYTNNLNDLVVIDVSDPLAAREISRTHGVFPDLAKQVPHKQDPRFTIYFECPDTRKGIVVAWEKKLQSGSRCSW